MHAVDIVVVGAGPAGLSFVRSLAGSGLSVAVVEQQKAQVLADPAFDGREIALTHASRQILETLGLWQRFDPAEISPMQAARVFNGGSLFSLDFAARTPAEGALGWLVPNHLIRRAAWQAVEGQDGLHLYDGVGVEGIVPAADHSVVQLADGRQLRARLVVAADSRFSATRRKMGIGAQMRDFGKSMLVCRVALERSHEQTAWEWFGHGSTMALLPLNDGQASAVITQPPRDIAGLLALDDAALGRRITGLFHERLGAMTPVARPQAYPLVAVYAHRFVGQRYALVGDAAVGMHPVTAHGFNFGLQSQQRLAAALGSAAATGRDIGADSLLAGYQRGHRLATRPLYEATNLVAGLYTDERLPARIMRSAALRVAQGVAPFRQIISSHLTQRQAAH